MVSFQLQQALLQSWFRCSSASQRACSGVSMTAVYTSSAVMIRRVVGAGGRVGGAAGTTGRSAFVRASIARATSSGPPNSRNSARSFVVIVAGASAIFRYAASNRCLV